MRHIIVDDDYGDVSGNCDIGGNGAGVGLNSNSPSYLI